ncbi:MAG: serine/threonine protein kinase, partial [Myxococcales bacterium]|nr:serine/threonine protein kinase [Myxococcales bacterium]
MSSEAGNHRQFVIHDCLGRGGFGEVYRATMVSPGGLRTKVALKLLRSDVDPGGDALLRLRDEGRLLAALRHPCILKAYDLALLDGRIGLVTEFVDGVDLHQVVGDLGPRAALAVLGNVAEALDAAWTSSGHDGDEPLRLVHRDIKPSNIRLSRHGEVKLLDFGIARSDEVDREARTGTGSTVGSLSYMAPERFSRRPPGPEADIYALGATLFELLAGRRLHDDPVPVEMFRLAANPSAHEQHVEEAIAELGEDTAPIVPLLRRMLAHTPEERPNAGEVARVAEELEESLEGPTLKRWARDWAWPEQERVAGSFDGRTITEGTLSRADVFDTQPTASSDTFSIDLDPYATTEKDLPLLPPTPEPRSEPDPEPERRALWIPMGAVVLLLLAGVGAWAVRGGPQSAGPPQDTAAPRVPQPPPAPPPVPVEAPEPAVPVPAPVEPSAPEPSAPEPSAPEPSPP